MNGEELEQYYMAALLSNPALVTKRVGGETLAQTLIELSDMASMAASLYDGPDKEEESESEEEAETE